MFYYRSNNQIIFKIGVFILKKVKNILHNAHAQNTQVKKKNVRYRNWKSNSIV